MRSALKHITLTLLIGAVLLASLASLSCRKDTGDADAQGEFGLSEAQKNNILAISEAFAESGFTYDSNNALTIKNTESFIYYLYNGELKADSNGYASVPEADAIERINAFFGVSDILRTHRTTAARQNYYFSDGKYHVLTNEPFASSIKILKVQTDENDNRLVNVDVDCVNGTKLVLEFVFTFNEDSTLVHSCVRYEEK